MRPQPKGVVCGHAHRLGGSDALRRLSSEPVLSEHPWVFKLCTPPLSTKTKSVATSQDVTLGLASQIAGHRSPRVGGTVRCLVAEPYLYLLAVRLAFHQQMYMCTADACRCMRVCTCVVCACVGAAVHESCVQMLQTDERASVPPCLYAFYSVLMHTRM